MQEPQLLIAGEQSYGPLYKILEFLCLGHNSISYEDILTKLHTHKNYPVAECIIQEQELLVDHEHSYGPLYKI